MTELEILQDRGFNPVSDLNYCLSNGIEYFVGYNEKRGAIVALIPPDESIFFIDKQSLREMAETAKIKGIKELYLYTNYGIELSSKFEKPECVGFTVIKKIGRDGYNFK